MAVPRTRVLRSICVNTAADAFAQIEIPTGLFSVEQGAGLLIRKISLQQVVNLSQAASANQQLALSRRSKTAMPDVTDPDCIFRWDKRLLYATAAAFASQQNNETFDFPSGDDALIDQLVVEDPLFAQLDSNGIGSVITINLRIQAEIVKVTEMQRLALISLSQG